jgi:hypothetical protein
VDSSAGRVIALGCFHTKFCCNVLARRLLTQIGCCGIVFGGTFALVSVSTRMISALGGDEESEKLHALSEQIETMQATQEAMREELLSLQHQP